MRSPSLLIALLTALPATTFAQKPAEPGGGRAASPSTSQPQAHPSSEARALSRSLVPRQTWDRLIDRSAQGLSEAVSRSLANKGAKVPDSLQGDIRRELAQNMKYEDAVDAQAQALEKRFTTEEMDSAARFYGSPVGKKMLERLPEAQSEVGSHLQEQLAMVVPEILHRVAPEAIEPGSPSGPQEGVGSGQTP